MTSHKPETEAAFRPGGTAFPSAAFPEETGGSPTSLSAMREWVVEEIRQAIIEGVLRPGDRLVERDVAERFGVSRSPVREAIRLLIFEGFLVARSPRRVVVRELSRRDVEDLYDVRESLEVLTAGLAVRNATSDDISRLRELLERMKLTDDEEALHRLGREFHEALTDVAGNPVLSGLVEPIRGRMRWLLQQNADFVRIYDEHAHLVDLIEARDVEEARAFAAEHVRHSRVNALASLFPEEDVDQESEGADGSESSSGGSAEFD